MSRRKGRWKRGRGSLLLSGRRLRHRLRQQRLPRDCGPARILLRLGLIRGPQQPDLLEYEASNTMLQQHQHAFRRVLRRAQHAPRRRRTRACPRATPAAPPPLSWRQEFRSPRWSPLQPISPQSAAAKQAPASTPRAASPRCSVLLQSPPQRHPRTPGSSLQTLPGSPRSPSWTPSGRTQAPSQAAAPASQQPQPAGSPVWSPPAPAQAPPRAAAPPPLHHRLPVAGTAQPAGALQGQAGAALQGQRRLLGAQTPGQAAQAPEYAAASRWRASTHSRAARRLPHRRRSAGRPRQHSARAAQPERTAHRVETLALPPTLSAGRRAPRLQQALRWPWPPAETLTLTLSLTAARCKPQ